MIEFVSADPRANAVEGVSTASLARALVAFEARFEAAPPNSVVLEDDSDAALAAALVAAKLGIELAARPEARTAKSANGCAIAQLAGTYTPAPCE